jgi:hypothetical protein
MGAVVGEGAQHRSVDRPGPCAGTRYGDEQDEHEHAEEQQPTHDGTAFRGTTTRRGVVVRIANAAATVATTFAVVKSDYNEPR